MLIYHYNPATKEYIGPEQAKKSPLDDMWLVPAYATMVEPPVVSGNEVAVWEGEAWEVKEDHRGNVVYDKITAQPSVIDKIGPIPDSHTESIPCPYPIWSGSQWTTNIEQACNGKLSELAAYRYSKETAGITVNGSKIKTDRESQAMLTGAKAYSDLNESATIDWKGENGWVRIDRAAILAISQAVAAHVQECFSNEKVHAEAIAALSTIADIEAYDITTGWPG